MTGSLNLVSEYQTKNYISAGLCLNRTQEAGSKKNDTEKGGKGMPRGKELNCRSKLHPAAFTSELKGEE